MKTDNTPPVTDLGRKARLLIKDGFCVLEDMLDADTLRHTRSVALKAVRDLSARQLEATRAPGTLIDSDSHPGLAECIGNPRALAALEAMGFGGSKFWKAVIISKPGPSPRLYWHQDCMWWDDPRAYGDYSPMIFLMYYLDDTSRENGCLRLLPGTHRRWHRLHEMGDAHTRDINRMDNEHDGRFADFPGEIDVPVRAGDLVVGDARLFHATHANTTREFRTLITIWFHPLFDELQEPTKSWIHHAFHRRHAQWPPEALDKIRPLIPDYRGTVEPPEFNRQPDRVKLEQAWSPAGQQARGQASACPKTY
ncbi:MAG: phytanoyl-CoA dioxygenase family protein [Rhodobacteraceae bacterium]|nr:phytanoyl-CoA dioxygenase family protein [Paracoccaceae bacterium]